MSTSSESESESGNSAAMATPTAPHTSSTSMPTSTTTTKTTTFGVMRRMAAQMRPLLSVEIKAITAGIIGHLASIWSVMLAAAGIVGAFRNAPTALWVTAIVAAIALALIRGPMAYAEQLFNHQMAFSVLRDIRSAVFDKMRSLAPAKLRREGRGNLITVITQDIELLEIFYAHTLSPLAIAALTTIISTIIFAVISPWLGLTAAITYLLLIIEVPLITAPPTYRAAADERNATGDLHSLILESLDGREQLVGMGAAARTRSRLNSATQSMLSARSRNGRARGWNDVITETIPLLGLAAFMAAAIWQVGDSGLDAAQAIVAVAGFTASFPAMMSVARLGSGLQPTLASARRVFALFDEEPAVIENTTGQEPGSFSSLTTSHLRFGYDATTGTDGAADEGDPILQDVDLSINPGEVVAVEGANGAGKSTLIDLLMRFRERTGGDIAVNGVPTEDIATHSLRSIETMISQDTFILDDTVAHNIAIARPHATREDIESAAHDAHLDDVLDQLPGGLDHRLTRNGSELSEGQRQRIAVARAFLSDAGLLLLDEPTSNMDALLEGQIMDALMSHQEGRSYLIVTHRDAVLARADRILMMSDGRLTPMAPVRPAEPSKSEEPNTTGTTGTATAAGDDTDTTTTANANEGRP